MVTSEYWERVIYRFPRLSGRGEAVSFLMGLDTEAYDTGEPFLVCMSDGASLEPRSLPGSLIDRYAGEHVAVYNLKYDSGALLYHMPAELKVELWVKGATKWAGAKVEYIPHKALFFSKGRHCTVKLWDVSQFFSMSLDRAAKKYLDKSKMEVETKTFTRLYVAKHMEKLRAYCVKDAQLCGELGTFLVSKLEEFGIRATALYSSAALSFRYFCDRTRLVSSWRYWKHHPQVLKAAMDSYEGGKFEVTGRGAFRGYEYDLVSAYPAEIAALVDISFARVVVSREYLGEAQYGFLRCRIENSGGAYIPCGLMLKKVRVYPTGEFFAAITKQEYDYLQELGVKASILWAVWLVCEEQTRPYAQVIDELYKVKALYKGKDPMLYEVSKRMMCSFYGKTCQMIEDWKGRIVAGPGWNPIYAAVITANTRIKVCRIQNAMREACLAVHTDSVITTKPLAPELIAEALGEFGFVEEGPGLIVACGQYMLGSKEAYKGFEPAPGDNWRKLLERYSDREYFPYDTLRVESWIECCARGDMTSVNLFQTMPKIVDLNCDSKRVWLRTVRGADLLSELEQSVPRAVVNTEPPKHWRL